MGVNFILQGAEANISRIKKGTEILQEEWNKTEQKAGDVFSDVRVTVKFHEGIIVVWLRANRLIGEKASNFHSKNLLINLCI